MSQKCDINFIILALRFVDFVKSKMKSNEEIFRHFYKNKRGVCIYIPKEMKETLQTIAKERGTNLAALTQFLYERMIEEVINEKRANNTKGKTKDLQTD